MSVEQAAGNLRHEDEEEERQVGRTRAQKARREQLTAAAEWWTGLFELG